MGNNDLSSRDDMIFDIVVKSNIETAEPVGSRTISRRYGVDLSPASIRNVMADLEEQGLLSQPHTSAGRVPTDRGYRYWVDSLMQPEELAFKEKEWINRQLQEAKTIEDLAEKVSKIISQITDNAALFYLRNVKRVSFLSYLLDELVEAHRLEDFLEEEPELYVEGAVRIFRQPEFQDLGKMRSLLQAFDEEGEFLQIFVKDLEEEGVHVHIGSENEGDRLDGVSLVVKDCTLGQMPIGGIAVVGPTRMKYPKVMSVVDYVADSLTEVVRRF